MSDPMTNREIEDVLSSIRRLVSEEVKPSPRPEQRGALPVGLQPVGKLVLTPAFRVAENPPVQAVAPVLADQAAVQAGSLAGRTEPADEHVLEVAAPPEVLVLERAQSRLGDPDAVQSPPGTEVPDEMGATPAEVPDLRPAQVEQLAPANLPGLVSDASASDALAEPEPDLSGVEEQGAVSADPHWDQAERSVPNRMAFWAAPSDEMARLEETIAELEAAVAASGQEFEPDGSEGPSTISFVLPPLAGNGVSGASAAPRRLNLQAAMSSDDAGQDAFASDPADSAQASDALPAIGEDALMDEAALRDLVIEIIRQELQGALGERITRNVRKLVRAEIHRAMAGREFE